MFWHQNSIFWKQNIRKSTSNCHGLHLPLSSWLETEHPQVDIKLSRAPPTVEFVAGNRGLRPPGTYVVRGSWPTGQLEGPRVATYAQLFAARVLDGMEGRTLRAVALAAGISHSTLHAVTVGDRWPDMVTVAKLEDALNAELWPGVEARKLLGALRR